MNFKNVQHSYRKNAPVQGQMANSLVLNLMKYAGKKFDKIFEIGAGTGFLTDKIRENLEYKEIILNDITENFTNFSPNAYIMGDIIEVDFPKNCDLIFSNAVFQWVLNYNLLFEKIYGALNFGGILGFSTFGEKNFSQIKDITGIGLNYPDFKGILQKKGFKILYYEEELNTLYFNNIKDVLSHIKYTGVKTENKIWTKKDFKHFEDTYLKKYKDDMGFELTYHPVFYIVRK